MGLQILSASADGIFSTEVCTAEQLMRGIFNACGVLIYCMLPLYLRQKWPAFLIDCKCKI